MAGQFSQLFSLRSSLLCFSLVGLTAVACSTDDENTGGGDGDGDGGMTTVVRDLIDEDGDGIPDGLDTDGDGIIDIRGTPIDEDGDGEIDGIDIDGDGMIDEPVVIIVPAGDGDGDGTGGTPGGDGDGDGDGDGTGGTGTGGNGTGGGPAPTGSYNCDAAEGDVPTLGVELVSSDFNRPLLVTHPAGDDRLFVIEQDGVIKIIDGGTVLEPPFLDISARVESTRNEQGLLGLAFHPNYANNGLFYVHYNNNVGGRDYGDTIIAEFSVSDGDPNVANADSERILIDEEQPDWNHNGGTIQFGPDGMLYIFLGDGGGGGDTYNQGQDETTLLAAILRIDVDSRDAGEYGVPAGNLSASLGTAAPEVYSYGLRNPYRANFDVCTGDLYVGDVGQNAWEEVTASSSGVGQLNYGWPIMEGQACFSPSSGCDETGLTIPQIVYDNPDGASVVGGSVYRGSEIPGFRGKFLYADTGLGRVWYSDYDSGTGMMSAPTELTATLGAPNAITSIQTDNNGEIYLTALFSGVYKLVAP